MKQTIRLTESELKNMITESVRKIFENTLDVDDSDIWEYADFDRDENNKWITRDEDEIYNDENFNIYESIKRNVRQVLKETSYDLARRAHKSAIQQRKYDQAERLHKHMVDRSSQRFDPNMPVIIVGGDKQGRYVAQDIIDNFDIKGYVEPSQNPIYTDSQLIGYPKIKGYIGPMWDGEKIRYESQDAYDFFSR